MIDICNRILVCRLHKHDPFCFQAATFSLLKRLLALNQIQAKKRAGFELAASSIFALFNFLLEMNRRLGLATQKPSIAHYFCL